MKIPSLDQSAAFSTGVGPLTSAHADICSPVNDTKIN